MILTREQAKELEATRAEVQAISGAASLAEARKVVDEVQQMMWAVDGAQYSISAASGIGKMLQAIHTKVAEVREIQTLVEQLKAN